MATTTINISIRLPKGDGTNYSDLSYVDGGVWVSLFSRRSS